MTEIEIDGLTVVYIDRDGCIEIESVKDNEGSEIELDAAKLGMLADDIAHKIKQELEGANEDYQYEIRREGIK
jgi:hypothetical protein